MLEKLVDELKHADKKRVLVEIHKKDMWKFGDQYRKS